MYFIDITGYGAGLQSLAPPFYAHMEMMVMVTVS